MKPKKKREKREEIKFILEAIRRQSTRRHNWIRDHDAEISDLCTEVLSFLGGERRMPKHCRSLQSRSSQRP